MTRLRQWLIDRSARRPADYVIGPAARPYLRRWWLIPRNRWFNVYLHQILRDDDDRALHDHPWCNASWVLAGGYVEHTIAAGGVHRRRARRAGSWTLRWPTAAHRLEVGADGAWSLFLTGPVVREWGFHCPGGWTPWRRFTDPADDGLIGTAAARAANSEKRKNDRDDDWT